MVELGDVAVGSIAPCNHAVAVATENDVDGRVAVEPAREDRRIGVGVDHRGAIRRGHERVREDVLQTRHVAHRRLAVVGAEDDGVALEELVGPAGCLDQSADGLVAAREGCVRRVRPLCVRGVVVVGEVEDEEVEAVAGDEPAADRRRVGVDRPPRPVAHRERRAGHVRLEEVVEEEAARAVRRTREEGHGRPVRMTPAVAGDVDRSGRQARVLERLVDGDCAAAEVARVEAVDRVDQRLLRPGRTHGAERGAVLDEPLLAAVVPDEVRDLVDVRVRPGRERREADGRQRREGRDRTAVAAVLGEQPQRGSRAALERVLQHRRRQAVDHDQDQFLSRGQGCAGRRTGRPGCDGGGGAGRGSAARPPRDSRAGDEGEPGETQRRPLPRSARARCASRHAEGLRRRRSRRQPLRRAPRPHRRRPRSSRRSRSPTTAPPAPPSSDGRDPAERRRREQPGEEHAERRTEPECEADRVPVPHRRSV